MDYQQYMKRQQAYKNKLLGKIDAGRKKQKDIEAAFDSAMPKGFAKDLGNAFSALPDGCDGTTIFGTAKIALNEDYDGDSAADVSALVSGGWVVIAFGIPAPKLYETGERFYEAVREHACHGLHEIDLELREVESELASVETAFAAPALAAKAIGLGEGDSVSEAILGSNTRKLSFRNVGNGMYRVRYDQECDPGWHGFSLLVPLRAIRFVAGVSDVGFDSDPVNAEKCYGNPLREALIKLGSSSYGAIGKVEETESNESRAGMKEAESKKRAERVAMLRNGFLEDSAIDGIALACALAIANSDFGAKAWRVDRDPDGKGPLNPGATTMVNGSVVKANIDGKTGRVVGSIDDFYLDFGDGSKEGIKDGLRRYISTLESELGIAQKDA